MSTAVAAPPRLIPIVHAHALAVAIDFERTWAESSQMTGSKDWPKGYCVEASIALRDELERDVPESAPEYIWGDFHVVGGSIEHAWVELGGGYVLDVTAAQFFTSAPLLPLFPPWGDLAKRYVVNERDPDWARDP